jgi:hypothetical protein
MTESPPPALEWWASLAPEVKKVWFHLITGWTIESAVNAAYARAMGEAKPVDAIPCQHCPVPTACVESGRCAANERREASNG